MSPKAFVAPSILNADLGNLTHDTKELLEAGADWVHLDVMDGHFVPNITFGHIMVDQLRKSLGPNPFFDVHLMVSKPSMWVQHMAEAGANMFTFHYEAVNDQGGPDAVKEIIAKIRENNLKVGIAIKPNTPVDAIIDYGNLIDMALIMTVEPGKGGQSFQEAMLEKVKTLRQKFPNIHIQVDGGVGPKNAALCGKAGANVLVSGTAVVKAPNKADAIRQIREESQKELDAAWGTA